jgi:hypothetical protein
VTVDGTKITVGKVSPDGRPKEITVDFQGPIDGEGYRFITWQDHAYVPFALPEVGDTVIVPEFRLWTSIGNAAQIAFGTGGERD